MWRQRAFPRLVCVISLLGIASAGCNSNQDVESLRELLAALGEALREDYQDEIKTHPREEWTVRRGTLTTRRDMKVIDDFMQRAPQLSPQGRAAVESLREVYRKRAELFEACTKEGRYRLTTAEDEEARNLMQEQEQRVKDIGRIVDGK
jgi:hypothetical protein